MKKIFLLFVFVFSFSFLVAQELTTRKDSLQGGLRPERTSYDVLHYTLNIKINPDEKLISGLNEIAFNVVENTSKIQIDLFDNMKIDSIVMNSKKLNYKREFHAVFIDFPVVLQKNTLQKIQFYYSGHPIVAKNAPWDGGFIFTKDPQGNTWVDVACQGTGASLWFPCKDSQSDEPDNGVSLKIAVPNGLMDVSNGRLIGSEDLKNGYTRWDWEVKNPINSYDITVNIGDYVHFGENYKGLDLDFYVLKSNEAQARKQFEQVKPMMDCFQSKFGEYPFKNDGYKLVETSYLGMEHQSAVAYGNKYMNGYLGSDLSGTGIGLLFDYIIIHESGHEWFGNSITSKDIADMWIHEGFTMYSEAVFIECLYGKEKALRYLEGLHNGVQNDKPIIGAYGVNKEGSGDMYFKGSLLLNTLRSTINNDDLWWKILYKYCTTFKHKIIEVATVIRFFNNESKMNLTPIFDQYLRYKDIPSLELQMTNGSLEYRWKTDVTPFNMPVDVQVNKQEVRLFPTNNWQKLKVKISNPSDLSVAKEKFFIKVKIN